MSLEDQVRHYWLISQSLLAARDGVAGGLVPLRYEDEILDELDTLAALTDSDKLARQAEGLLAWARNNYARAVA